MKSIAKILFTVACFLGSVQLFSKTTLPSFFTDNMVLQQNTAVPFWGTSAKNTSVTITASWNDKSYTVTSGADGNWKVTLQTPSYGGPYTITVDDGSRLMLKNILIGDVWLCSGQSNMEMPLAGWGKINNYKEEIANANYPEIRLLQAEHVYSETPLDKLKVQNGGWQVCSPQTIADFSSTAYFFARKIYKEKHIPIGLLHSSWGGTVIEAWTEAGALKTIHDFDKAIDEMQEDQGVLAKRQGAALNEWMDALEKADKGFKNGTPVYILPEYNDGAWAKMELPGLWENGGLPDFDGVVWYRREIELPDDFVGKPLTLTFFADDDDKVWFNGKEVGATKGYNVKRQYTIAPDLIEKRNSITIRVFDGTGGGGIYGDKNEFTLSSGNTVFSLAGEWKYTVGISSTDLAPMPVITQGQNKPTALYNAMIHPILNYKIKGVIWYQGESNDMRAHQYQTLFPLMIKDWREKFKNPGMPFYFVQLAGFKAKKNEPGSSAWAELRDAQFKALTLPNTGMAVAIDIGNAEDIHPKNKQEVGERLARIALAKVYGVNIDYSGPLYKSYAVKNSNIVLTFDFDEKLQAKNGDLKGFSIAGADKKFYWANAKIQGNVVVVSSPQVKNPVAVRYNWADNPEGNLTNASGLPASPFRTDDWEGITFGKK
ncbi:sialate O-acetylesterase [Flavobacterium rhizosphaerae]|uniref:Sialate O-acetylesterase n=1 Tax=Flavobacterium rhizosphaerae TaxID=3163298 RepID=A0ABW8YU34_9FLAO